MCQLYFCWLVYPRKADSSCEDGVVKVHEVLWLHKWTLSPVKEGHALSGRSQQPPSTTFIKTKHVRKAEQVLVLGKAVSTNSKVLFDIVYPYPVHTLSIPCPLTHKCYSVTVLWCTARANHIVHHVVSLSSILSD